MRLRLQGWKAESQHWCERCWEHHVLYLTQYFLVCKRSIQSQLCPGGVGQLPPWKKERDSDRCECCKFLFSTVSKKSAEFFWVIGATKILYCNLQLSLLLWRSFDCISLPLILFHFLHPSLFLFMKWLPRGTSRLVPTGICCLLLIPSTWKNKASVWFPLNFQNLFLMPINVWKYLCMLYVHHLYV